MTKISHKAVKIRIAARFDDKRLAVFDELGTIDRLDKVAHDEALAEQGTNVLAALHRHGNTYHAGGLVDTLVEQGYVLVEAGVTLITGNRNGKNTESRVVDLTFDKELGHSNVALLAVVKELLDGRFSIESTVIEYTEDDGSTVLAYDFGLPVGGERSNLKTEPLAGEDAAKDFGLVTHRKVKELADA